MRPVKLPHNILNDSQSNGLSGGAALLCALFAGVLLTACASSGTKGAGPRSRQQPAVESDQTPPNTILQAAPGGGGARPQPTLIPGTGSFTRSTQGSRAGQPLPGPSGGSPGLAPTVGAGSIVAPGPGPNPSSSAGPGNGTESGPGAGSSNATPSASGPTGMAMPPGIPLPEVKAHAAVQEQLELSFIDTEIGVVISSVLGDGLGLAYVVDPSIKGTMTLQASRGLTREEVLPALENALRLYGIAMVEVNGTYNIVPMADARRRVLSLRTAGDTSVGYGIQVVPLQYVSVNDIEKTLRSVSSEGAIVRVDEGRNLLLVAGTSQERAALLDIVKTFDVDWLAGMSFAVFPFQYIDAKTAAEELSHVFSEEKSPIANVVRFIPLGRLNALLVVSYQPHYLQEIETWIHRLDIGTSGSDRRIYVYDVQNGKADDLAKSLAEVLSLSYGGGDTTSNPLISSRNAGSGLSVSQGASGTGLGGTGFGSSGIGSGVSSTGMNGSGFGSAGGLGSSSGMSGYDDRSGYDRNNGSSRLGATSRMGGMGGGNSGMSIAPNVESNSLMILATPGEFTMVEAALKRLDVPPMEVMIEATLAEVTLTDQLRFGLQWSYATKQGPVTFSEASSGAIAQQFPGLSFLYTGRPDINAVLSSLETLTKVKVLSSPKLLVLNNREAELKIGDQVPIITQSAVGTLTSNSTIVNSVDLKDTGVILRVIPRVNKNGLVTLEVSQEVSDVGATTTSSINSPTIHQRQMSSTVEVRNGETIALGGLIRESVSNGRDGLPLLSRIPLLGALFGSTSHENDRTELLVLITPHVIRSSEESADLMDDLRSQFKALRKMIPPQSPPMADKRESAGPDSK